MHKSCKLEISKFTYRTVFCLGLVAATEDHRRAAEDQAALFGGSDVYGGDSQESSEDQGSYYKGLKRGGGKVGIWDSIPSQQIRGYSILRARRMAGEQEGGSRRFAVVEWCRYR